MLTRIIYLTPCPIGIHYDIAQQSLLSLYSNHLRPETKSTIFWEPSDILILTQTNCGLSFNFDCTDAIDYNVLRSYNVIPPSLRLIRRCTASFRSMLCAKMADPVWSYAKPVVSIIDSYSIFSLLDRLKTGLCDSSNVFT